ncbi:MAG TPA: porin family protein [Gemmatimonadales bacterium]|nr:porin family protein [Gemmatimonadales bacterium]
MKRGPCILTALLLAPIPATTYAQDTGERRVVEFGVKGGVSFGNVSDKGVLPGDLEGRTGLSLGVVLATAPHLFGLGIEGFYTQTGLETPSGTPTAGRELDYIDIPGYVRLMIPTPGIKPYAFAGPMISFEVRCKSGDTDCPDIEPLSGEEREKTTYAGVIGAGLRFGDRGGFAVEGRYVYGLTDLKLGTVTSGESYKNRTFLILGSFVF